MDADRLDKLVFLFDSVDTINNVRNSAETLQQQASNPFEYARMDMKMEECDNRMEETVARIQELGGVSEQEREEVENFRLARRERSRLEGIRQSEVPLAQAPSDDTIGVGSPPPSVARLPPLAGQDDQDVEESKLPPLRQPSPVSINARAPSDDTIGVGSPPPSVARLPPLAPSDDTIGDEFPPLHQPSPPSSIASEFRGHTTSDGFLSSDNSCCLEILSDSPSQN